MIRFNESGMTFEFDDDNCFRIEDDPLVKNTQCKSTSNNMACECISFIDGHHYFIEAKQSVPRKLDSKFDGILLNGKPVPKSWEIYDNYQHFLRSISKKFIDSFQILRSIIEGRHGKHRCDEIPLSNKHINLDELRFVLVVNFPPDKNVVKEELVSLTDALRNEMRPFLKIWKIHDSAIKIVVPEDAKQMLHIPIV